MKYPQASIATDICIFTIIENKLYILLVDRKEEPFGWSLPGGFFTPEDKNLDICAIRELREETAVKGFKLIQFGIYSEGQRDPRYPRTKGKDLGVVSVAYFALIPRSNLDLQAGSDAKKTDLRLVSQIPKLAFDHNKIVKDAYNSLAARALDDNLLLELMPKAGFSISELKKVYEAVGKGYKDAANFQRHVQTKLVSTGLIQDTGDTTVSGKGGPPARLYSYCPKSQG